MPERTVIVSDSCPHCKHVQDKIAEKNLPVKVVNYLSKEGMDLVRKFGIRAVPECVIVDEKGEVRKCTDAEFEDMW